MLFNYSHTQNRLLCCCCCCCSLEQQLISPWFFFYARFIIVPGVVLGTNTRLSRTKSHNSGMWTFWPCRPLCFASSTHCFQTAFSAYCRIRQGKPTVIYTNSREKQCKTFLRVIYATQGVINCAANKLYKQRKYELNVALNLCWYKGLQADDCQRTQSETYWLECHWCCKRTEHSPETISNIFTKEFLVSIAGTKIKLEIKWIMEWDQYSP